MNLLISIIIGAMISVMILFNGTISNTLGTFSSSIIVHFVGLFSIILVLLISKTKIRIHRGIPFYFYIAGAIGVFTVVFTNITFAKLGVSLTLALGLLGQSIFSIIIDHFGLLGMKIIKFNNKKYIGLFIIAFGIFIMTIY
ncbi:MAG: DMT family transporter [Mobilitalea sp.]